MSADDGVMIRKGLPSGRWYVEWISMSDEVEPLPTDRTASFDELEDALTRASKMETEYGVFLGGDFDESRIPKKVLDRKLSGGVH